MLEYVGQTVFHSVLFLFFFLESLFSRKRTKNFKHVKILKQNNIYKNLKTKNGFNEPHLKYMKDKM